MKPKLPPQAKISPAEAALIENREHYTSLFEDVPISLWEQDFSAVQAYFDALRAQGVTDFKAYFESHPDSVTHCVGLVKILDMNQVTVHSLK